MTYVYPFDHPHDVPFEEVKAIVGGKGANLGLMTTELGLPVPPGFTISTDACRAYLEGGWPAGLTEEIRAAMGGVEETMGRRFGEPSAPLLVSVRSGAPISMPGMMDTILNLGLNDATEQGLADSSGTAFAAACRERLTTMYRDIVGVDEVPADPWEQLQAAVEAVFRSWNGDRARTYRAHEGIPEDLGTAVNVQAMVFGNLGEDSGTGVIFTRNPATGEAELYGDVLFDAQGEDVVAGTHATEPIGVLDGRMPEISAELRRYADALERHYADVCDIEFTIERGKLWMLQNRIGKRTSHAALRFAVDMAEDEDFPLTREQAVERVADLLADPPRISGGTADAPVLATGLGASPGIASGEIVVSADAAVEAEAAGRTVILVRPETSPNDVHGMLAAAGILTSTGGLTSHAAVVARGLDKPAVVGAAGVKVGSNGVEVAGTTYAIGDLLTLDGGKGTVYAGDVAGESAIVPEAEILLGWAAELGLGPAEAGEGSTTVASEEDLPDAGIPLRDLAVRALLIKGFATAEAFAPVIVVEEDAAAAELDDMVAEGVAEPMGPMFKLSAEGKAAGEAMLAADSEVWGLEAAGAALDAFIPLDQRMKHIVTAWQMKEVDGQPVMNDHTDAGYDAAVLADFAALAEEAGPWVASLLGGLQRFDVYRVRLARAAARVAAGEHNFIASPQVDSYHNVWFELHEDLIRLAGRTREEETAAGRA